MTADKFDLEAAKKVLGRHSSVAAAERELGLPYRTLAGRFRSRGLHAANFLARVAVPEGMRIKTVTTGPQGRTVHAELESKDPPTVAILPPAHLIKGVSSYIGADGAVRAQWVKTKQEQAQREALFLKACERSTRRYRGIASKVRAPEATERDMHVIIPLGDPHVGLLAWGPETGTNFDVKIAERELFAVVEDLVRRAPPAARCTLLNLGDYFHAQDDRQVTPAHGNKLDVDGRSAKVQEIGFSLMRRLVDCALSRFKTVRAHMVPGNHDPDLARMMAIWLKAVYEREPRVNVIPNYNPFHYWTHGANLFGTTHGNGLKLRDLPGIMAADVPELWGKTTHRFIHTGHVHHDSVVEVQGTLVYTWRTVAANDSWAHGKGYRAGKSLCALAYDRAGGEVSRVSVDLGTIRRRLEAKAA